ncbi:MAG: CRISPR-associated endonuclease Cas2 [Nitrospinae bacterium RIFCSPLOWO2_12_FULL_45_22]|nr:MAG: CRISPR-associated endonuclease Cas2 [Nitrospinae bacterium RIFCSPLOWO2_12_FULL_45_22]
MFVVVSYDIIDDKRRNKLADLLKDYGTRVQYSVFECSLDEKYLQQMIQEVRAIIDPEGDSLKIYYLCHRCAGNRESYGQKGSEPPDELVVI